MLSYKLVMFTAAAAAGQGVVTYKNGDKYGGEWRDGKRHGNGTLWVLQDGKYNVRYSGDWLDDLPEVG
jgi:hypothetical protein